MKRKKKTSAVPGFLRLVIKILLGILAILIILLVIGMNRPQPVPEPTAVPTAVPTAEPEPEDFDSWIRWRVRHYISTTVDRVTINDDLGTDDPDDKIYLVYFNWDELNTEKTAQEVLKVYSDEIIMDMKTKFPEASEIALFWQSSYLHKTIKYTFER